MRIDGSSGASGLPETERTGTQSSSSVGGQPSATEAQGGGSLGGVLGEDQAELSGTHVQVQALTAQALQFPEIRQQKVNALRQVVEDGSYQPSSGQIADAMFTHMLQQPAA
jgi:flagellar biosynthesis anti-sigma factor FlgM